ncbi:MAG: GNAT family N-acetyltransferase [Clostridiales bacterium]|nr:GNAT family N-acetyltransferase [Clostridiales bacterium]
MDLHIKKLQEMTPDELYDIMKLRVDVFVVEQECLAPELDGRDKDAIHVWFTDEEGVQAYLRVLAPGVEHPEYPAIGRVLTSKKTRGTGLGGRLLAEGVCVTEEVYGKVPIYLEAQVYAAGYYGKQGFEIVSDEFILDGIPHYKMVRPADGGAHAV